MSSSDNSRTSNYGVPSRVLAALLSPWVVILFAIGVFGILYYFYYRPRLYYSYRAFPSPHVYYLPPYHRRRKFRKNPIAYLSKAKEAGNTTNIFWTDVVKGYDRKTISIVTEETLILQFISREDRDSLSWDAPLRSAWANLFDNHSSFGSTSFWNASKYCLTNGFSPLRTSVGSPNAQIVNDVAHSALADFREGNLSELVGAIVSRALLQIFLGSSVTHRILDLNREILSMLQSEKPRRKKMRLYKTELVTALQHIIQERLDDIEKYADTSDYLQWVIRARYLSELDFSSPDLHKGITPSDHTRAGSETATEDSLDETSKQQREERLKQDLPDHIIATFLQTHLLITSCIIWAIYSELTIDHQFLPDPLLLVRKTRKESLLGNVIIPKDCYVAISPILQRNGKPLGDTSYPPERKRQPSVTELSTLSAVNSVTDLTDPSHDGSIFTLRNSPSTGSFSPLLRETKYSTSTSLNDLSETSNKPNIESLHKSRKGSWVRRHPQGHLISLIVGSVANTLSRSLALTGTATVEQKYGSARMMWLPFPSAPIYITKVQSSTRSVFTIGTRSGSVSQLTKSRLPEELELKG